MDTLKEIWAFVARAFKRFIADACPGRAAGLAFSTLFALVPLAAIVIAVLTAFGVFDSIFQASEWAVLGELIPTVSDEVLKGVTQFASNTRALGLLGFFVFAVTAILLIKNINTSLNAIWRFRPQRGLWGTVATYTSVIALGTTLIAVSAAVGPTVESILVRFMGDDAGSRWFQGWFFSSLLLYLTLFLMNILVPSGRVRPGSAAFGAGISTVAWVIAKRVFAVWTGSVMKLSVIYGSLATVPIFLIWLYLTWFIALAGVELAFVFQHRLELLRSDDDENGIEFISELIELGIRTYLEVVKRFIAAVQPLQQEELDAAAGTMAGDLVRNSLERSGLIVVTDRGILPARHLETVTLDVLLGAVLSEERHGSAGESTFPWSLAGSQGIDDQVRQPGGSPNGGDSPGPVFSRLVSLWQESPDLVITSPKVLSPETTPGSGPGEQ